MILMRIIPVIVAALVTTLAAAEICASDFTIIALGDSTTARRPGIERVYADRIGSLLTAKGIDARIVNVGVPRHTTVDARKSFEKAVLAHDPAIVIIQFGINDSFVDVHKGSDTPRVAKGIFERNLDYFAAALEASGAQPIFMTPNPLYWTPDLRNRFGKAPYDIDDRFGLNLFNGEYAASVRRIAAERELPLIDIYQHYVDHDEKNAQSADRLLLDGMHPNDEGHKITAALLAERIIALRNAIISVPLVDLAGQSWRREAADSLPAEESDRYGRSTDGKKLIRIAGRDAGGDRPHWMESSDMGATWSPLGPVPAVLHGDGHAIARAADGRYVVAFRDRFKGSRCYGDCLIWVGSWRDIMKGSSGRFRIRLVDAVASEAPPAAIHLGRLDDGTFLFATRCALKNGAQPEPVAVRFGLAEVDWAARIGKPIPTLGHRGKVRVACVGDAIPYGQGLRNRRKYAFPVQLEKMLGVKWEVRNFGVPGATVLEKGQKPYGKEEAFEKVRSWRPDVVICAFGMSDMLGGNWQHAAGFASDYEKLLEKFDSMHSAPRIWICDPPPIFPGHRRYDQLLSNRNELRALVWETARSIKVPVIDFFSPLEDRSDLFVSGLHPNAGASCLLAGAVFKALTGRRWILTGDLPREIAPLQPPAGERLIFVDGARAPGAYSSWYARKDYIEGFEQHRYLVANSGVGKGDFCISARLRLREQRRSDAAFLLGRNFFGFEGSREKIFVSGPIFGGTEQLDPSSNAFKSGSWIDFRVVRRGTTLQFLIDGNVIHTIEDGAQAYEPIGFCPGRATVQLSHFSLVGSAIAVSPPMAQGYSIPTVDLAAESERQVVVDREEGQYLGHPTTVLLEDGRTMICVYPKGHGRGAIVMKRSTDAGSTWSGRLPTPKSWETSMEVPTIYRVADRSGNKRLILFSGLYPIRVSVSDDDGASWSELEEIGDYGGIVAMGDVVALDEPGHYMALFHDDGRFLHNSRRTHGKMEVYKTFSRDGGLTWSDPETILSRGDVMLCEPGAIRSPDGKTIAVLMRENSRRRNSHVMFSIDEGTNFTEPLELPGSLTGDRHTLRYAPDGRIVATFRDTCLDSPTQGDWVGWVGTWDDIVQRREGQYRIRFMDNRVRSDCAYPGLELLPDGTFVTTTYGHWTKGQKPYIVSVRFRLDDLDTEAARLGEKEEE